MKAVALFVTLLFLGCQSQEPVCRTVEPKFMAIGGSGNGAPAFVLLSDLAFPTSAVWLDSIMVVTALSHNTPQVVAFDGSGLPTSNVWICSDGSEQPLFRPRFVYPHRRGGFWMLDVRTGLNHSFVSRAFKEKSRAGMKELVHECLTVPLSRRTSEGSKVIKVHQAVPLANGFLFLGRSRSPRGQESIGLFAVDGDGDVSRLSGYDRGSVYLDRELQLLASFGDVAFAFLPGSGRGLVRVDAAGFKMTLLSDAPIWQSDAKIRDIWAGRLEREVEMYRGIERGSGAIGIVAWKRSLFAILKGSSEGGETAWFLHQLDPETGAVVRHGWNRRSTTLRLPTTAHGLVVAPGPHEFALFESAAVGATGSSLLRPVTSITFVSSAWIRRQLQRRPSAVPQCQQEEKAVAG